MPNIKVLQTYLNNFKIKSDKAFNGKQAINFAMKKLESK